MINADLHIHSSYSNDGEFGVRELIEKCVHKKMNTIAITDHNSISAINEALPICTNAGIDLIPGIEIDCSFRGTDLHLLGYHIDWQSSDFTTLEKSIRKKVMDSFPQMIHNLGKLGIDVDEKEVLAKADGQLPSGELIAEVLLANQLNYSNPKLQPYVDGGDRSDMPYINFYHDFFAQGKPAYVKIGYMEFHDAIDLVKRNGGTPVIAHPGLNLKGKEELVTELLQEGAEGLEVFNNYHLETQIHYFAALCMHGSVLMTCGSDFHGKNKPLIQIGEYKTHSQYDNYLQRSIAQLKKHGASHN